MVRRGLPSAPLVVPWTLVIVLHLYSCTAATATGFEQGQVNCQQPPLEAHPKDCCLLPSLIDEDLLRNCKSLYGGEPLQRKLIYERGKCFVECALNATGTMVNGRLDQAKILSLIESATQTEPVLMQLFRDNTLQCLQVSPSGRSDSRGQGCGTVGVDFVSCMNIRNFLNCPQTYWSNTDSCNRLKLFIQNCPRPI